MADHPLQAANAYRSIVEALVSARQAAEAADEAAETAYARAYPDNLDISLVESAKLSREKSRELVLQSERMRKTVDQHKEQLKGERTKLDAVEIQLKKAKMSNEETNADMDKLLQGKRYFNQFFKRNFWKNLFYFCVVRDRAKAAVERSTDTLSKCNSVSRQTFDISTLIESELRVKLLTMQNNRNVGYGNVPKLSTIHFFKKTFHWQSK